MSLRRIVAIVLAAAATALVPGIARAQDRLYQGLFRPSENPAASRNRVDLYTSVDYSYDHVRYDSTLLGVLERPISGSGHSPGGSLAMTYAHKGQRSDFGLAGGGYYRTYSQLPGQSYPTFHQSMRYGFQVSPRVQLRFNQGLVYSKYYGYDGTSTVVPGPDDVVPPVDNLIPPQNEYYTERRANATYTGGGEMAYRFDERSTLTTSFGGRHVDFRDASPDMTSGIAGIRYNRRMTQYSTLRLGYAFSLWKYPEFNTNLVSHDIDIGVTYSRPLPGSRRTRVGFDISSAFAGDPGSTEFRVNGGAWVAHILSPMWSVSGGYRRDNEVVEGFALPFFLFTDSVSASVSGVIFRFLSIAGGGGYSYGRYHVSQVESHTKWANAWVLARAPIYKTLAGYVQAGTGAYDFDRRLGVYRTTPLSSTSYWIRGGLVFGLPLIT